MSSSAMSAGDVKTHQHEGRSLH